MRQIELTRGMSCLVDDEDYARLSEHRWYASPCGDRFYAGRMIVRDGKRMLLHMHRELILDADTVDHINGNSLDNRRRNLRPASHSENQANKGKPRTRSPVSRFKGVALNRGRNASWYAYHVQDGKKIRLGSFPNEIAAALAYDRAVRQRDGAFARPNFPYGAG
jgi:hypothetical protein